MNIHAIWIAMTTNLNGKGQEYSSKTTITPKSRIGAHGKKKHTPFRTSNYSKFFVICWELFHRFDCPVSQTLHDTLGPMMKRVLNILFFTNSMTNPMLTLKFRNLETCWDISRIWRLNGAPLLYRLIKNLLKTRGTVAFTLSYPDVFIIYR